MKGRAAAIAVALLTFPAASEAGTVTLHRPPCADEQGKYGQCNPDEATFTAAPGERNDLTFKYDPASPGSPPASITFHDSGATLQVPDKSCEQIDEHTARCTSYALIAIVDAGDG